MHIVVDGYNLIRQSPHLSALDRRDLQAGREALVDALAAYKKTKPLPITVIFDGRDAPPGMPRRERLKGIDLRYSQPGESADTVIKRMAAGQREKLMVVSSDNEVAAYAAAKGAAVISSAEFEERMAMARMADAKGAGEENSVSVDRSSTTKKRGPARRLPKRQRRMRRKIDKL